MSDVTFRDFAGALMGNDDDAAASTLQTLLGVDDAKAARGTASFKEKMQADPQFMMKAMGMRRAVEAKDEAQLAVLIHECFELPEDEAAPAAKHLLARY